MSGEQWSEWISHEGSGCPLTGDKECYVRFADGEEDFASRAANLSACWDATIPSNSNIIAYRYKIEEPESGMHPDREWLARNLSEWPLKPKAGSHGIGWYGLKDHRKPDYIRRTCLGHIGDEVVYLQWVQDRKDLGLIMTEEEEEMPAEDHARTAPDFLQQAASLMQERGKQYDQPGGERSMGKTIAAFNAITGRDLSEPEGWMLMGLLKTVRQYSGDYHQDSAEDKIAYAALEAESLEASALRARELEK